MREAIYSPDQSVKELIGQLQQQIASAEAEAYADCERYEEEARERVKDRRERLFYELRPVREQLSVMFKHIADIEALKLPAPIVVTTSEEGWPNRSFKFIA